jgi:hypothetical protein
MTMVTSGWMSGLPALPMAAMRSPLRPTSRSAAFVASAQQWRERTDLMLAEPFPILLQDNQRSLTAL